MLHPESTFLFFEEVGVFCHPQRSLEFDFTLTQQILQRGRGDRVGVQGKKTVITTLKRRFFSLSGVKRSPAPLWSNELVLLIHHKWLQSWEVVETSGKN